MQTQPRLLTCTSSLLNICAIYSADNTVLPFYLKLNKKVNCAGCQSSLGWQVTTFLSSLSQRYHLNQKETILNASSMMFGLECASLNRSSLESSLDLTCLQLLSLSHDCQPMFFFFPKITSKSFNTIRNIIIQLELQYVITQRLREIGSRLLCEIGLLDHQVQIAFLNPAGLGPTIYQKESHSIKQGSPLSRHCFIEGTRSASSVTEYTYLISCTHLLYHGLE